jgi:hypothetical protein
LNAGADGQDEAGDEHRQGDGGSAQRALPRIVVEAFTCFGATQLERARQVASGSVAHPRMPARRAVATEEKEDASDVLIR